MLTTPPAPRSHIRWRAARQLASLPAIILLAATGCRAAVPATRPGPPPDPAALLAELRARQQRVPTLDARVRATSWLSGDRLRATVNVLADRVGHLRFDAEVSLQGTVAMVTTAGGEFASLDLQKGTLTRGPACPANVASLMKIPLLPEEVAAILMGDVALAGEDRQGTGDSRVLPSSAQLVWDASRGLDRVDISGRDGSTLGLLFEPADASGRGDRRLRGVVATDRHGKPWWRTSYEDFESISPADGRGPLSLPGLVRFAERDRSFDDGVDVKFKERRVGAPLAEGTFTLKDPPGIAAQWIGCPGASTP